MEKIVKFEFSIYVVQNLDDEGEADKKRRGG